MGGIQLDQLRPGRDTFLWFHFDFVRWFFQPMVVIPGSRYSVFLVSFFVQFLIIIIGTLNQVVDGTFLLHFVIGLLFTLETALRIRVTNPNTCLPLLMGI